jgi:hypothetical protein
LDEKVFADFSNSEQLPSSDLDLGMNILPELAKYVKASRRQYFESQSAAEIRL